MRRLTLNTGHNHVKKPRFAYEPRPSSALVRTSRGISAEYCGNIRKSPLSHKSSARHNGVMDAGFTNIDIERLGTRVEISGLSLREASFQATQSYDTIRSANKRAKEVDYNGDLRLMAKIRIPILNQLAELFECDPGYLRYDQKKPKIPTTYAETIEDPEQFLSDKERQMLDLFRRREDLQDQMLMVASAIITSAPWSKPS